jgi:RNA polymerase sigma-70 factor (ECF subfamily)
VAVSKTLSMGAESGAPSDIDVGKLFDQHAEFLLRMVRRVSGSQDRADDVVQRVFLIAHQKRDTLRDHPQIRGWLYQVAMNVIRHERRSLSRRLRLAGALKEEPSTDTAEPTEARFEAAEQSARVRACIAKLPMEQREVFVLYELEELRGGEIATMLQLPENTVWSRLRLARTRFKRAWQQAESGAK